MSRLPSPFLQLSATGARPPRVFRSASYSCPILVFFSLTFPSWCMSFSYSLPVFSPYRPFLVCTFRSDSSYLPAFIYLIIFSCSQSLLARPRTFLEQYPPIVEHVFASGRFRQISPHLVFTSGRFRRFGTALFLRPGPFIFCSIFFHVFSFLAPTLYVRFSRACMCSHLVFFSGPRSCGCVGVFDPSSPSRGPLDTLVCVRGCVVLLRGLAPLFGGAIFLT